MAHRDDLPLVADRCLTSVRDNTSGRASFALELEALLAGLRASDRRFDYDRGGRPGALAAIRGALPAIEAELLDAVSEDHDCEVAALREALFLLAEAGVRHGHS